MSLTPEQKKLLDETIERRVAAAAARKIHRLIADDEADARKGKRFAAVVTSVVLVVMVLCLAYVTVPDVLNDFRTGIASPDLHRRNTIGLVVGVSVTVIVLWLAFYLAVTFPRPARFAKLAVAAAAVLAFSAGAAYWLGVPVVGSATETNVHLTIIQTHVPEGSGAVGALMAQPTVAQLGFEPS